MEPYLYTAIRFSSFQEQSVDPPRVPGQRAGVRRHGGWQEGHPADCGTWWNRRAVFKVTWFLISLLTAHLISTVLQFSVTLALRPLTIATSVTILLDVSFAVPHVRNSPLVLFVPTSPSISCTDIYPDVAVLCKQFDWHPVNSALCRSWQLQDADSIDTAHVFGVLHVH